MILLILIQALGIVDNNQACDTFLFLFLLGVLVQCTWSKKVCSLLG